MGEDKQVARGDEKNLLCQWGYQASDNKIKGCQDGVKSSIIIALLAIEKGSSELWRKDLWLLLEEHKSRVGREERLWCCEAEKSQWLRHAPVTTLDSSLPPNEGPLRLEVETNRVPLPSSRTLANQRRGGYFKSNNLIQLVQSNCQLLHINSNNYFLKNN